MEIVYWTLIIFFFLLSILGLIFPVIPSGFVIWGGFLTYQFLIDSKDLSWLFWVGMFTFTILMLVLDIVANKYFVKQTGGSKWGERMAMIGTLIGSFIVPPFGILIVPFLMVLLVESQLEKRNLKEANQIAISTVVSFLISTVAKAYVLLLMIIWFTIEVWK